jgi:protein-tyrosine-phosphatase
MKILFVCSGNTCRSPLAAAFARKLAEERRMYNLSFDSAGTGALDGGGASEAAILVGLERGVDLSAHRTRALTPALIAHSDFVLVMGPQHLDTVRIHGSESKVRLLDHFTSGGETANAINDPFGGSLDDYRTTASELQRQVERLLDRLVERGTR